MKRHFFGTICACIGLACAAGATIVSGLLAIAFLSVAAIALRQGAKQSEEVSTTYTHAA